jgi:histidine phosphotransferase ChpT
MMESTRFASLLASRIFHDLVSPLTVMIQGSSIAFDDEMGPAMKGEGEKLMKESLAGIDAKIQFMRFAIGSQAMTDGWTDPHAAKALFDKLFSVGKQKLDWKVETFYISNRQMRVLMNITLMVMEAAGKVGTVRVMAWEDAGDLVLEVQAIGLPGELKSDVRDALAGKEPERGWGAGIQPLFTKMIAEEEGMTLSTHAIDGGTAVTVRGPRAPD